MGCGGSSCAKDQQKKGSKAGPGLQVASGKVHFQPEQLNKLDEYFKQLARRDRQVSRSTASVEATVERLVQRLVVGVGNLDSRFRATFLVSLNEPRRIEQLRFEYLLRLDGLSEGGLSLSVEEDSALSGYARLSLRTGDTGPWTDFLGPDGRLRRDLVKAKLAALLATATRRPHRATDDGQLCATPGQVVDAEVLDKILKQPEHCRVFYGPAEVGPEIGEPRIAIVEDESGIVLKVGLEGSLQSRDVEVRLLVGASVNSWPARADYPRRIPLHHSDALLHYSAAQTGMYVVASAPRQGYRCEERATLWRIRLLAAEVAMRQHYCDESVPAIVEAALMHVIDQLRARLPVDFSVKRKGSLRLVSRHIARSIYWWRLEDPLADWTSDRGVSQHVISCLDDLLKALRCQNLRCYFQPGCNLMIQSTRGGLVQSEEAYAAEARQLEAYLVALHAYSVEWLPEQATSSSSAELLERELMNRWRQVMATMSPRTPPDEYNTRQLQYLGLLVGEVLRAKDSLLRNNNSASEAWSSLVWSGAGSAAYSESTENLVYLVCLALRQAKGHRVTGRKPRRRRTKRGGGSSRSERKTSCARAFFERSVDVLVDIVRRDRETAYLDLDDHTVMARALLKWLHYGMERDKRVLGPLLRPYLGRLSSAARENAWHVESWRRRRDTCAAEMRSLGHFCKLVGAGELPPARGVAEALARGCWAWAEGVARTLERTGAASLVFLDSERVLRYQLEFAKEDGGPGSLCWSRARGVGTSAVRRASAARTSLMAATDTLPGLMLDRELGREGTPRHIELRDASPLTHAAKMARRRGRQRGPGGLIPALVTLNKFRVLQEAAQALPPKERTSMLELVQQAQRDAARRRRRAISCPDQLNNKSPTTSEPRQLYTPKSESALHEEPAAAVTRDPSPGVEQRVVLERELQLRREILEIHDTLSRGLRSRSHLPSWDALSLASSSLPSTGSVGRARVRRRRTPVWTDSARGTWSLWGSVSCNSTFSRLRPGSNARGTPEGHPNDESLPTWDALEKALQEKISTHEDRLDSRNEDGNANVDYIVVGNETREVARRS